MLRSLSDEQKEMLIYSIQSSFNSASKNNQKALIEALAEDEKILQQFEEIYYAVFAKLKQEHGESNILNTQGGIWNIQPQ